MKKLLIIAGLAVALAGCTSEADVASYNISQSADMFQVNRRITFINGITNDYMLKVEGLCSLGNHDTAREITVTCKTGPGMYKKHFVGLSDNVTFVSEQIDPFPSDPYHYTVVFKPSTLIPDIKVQ